MPTKKPQTEPSIQAPDNPAVNSEEQILDKPSGDQSPEESIKRDANEGADSHMDTEPEVHPQNFGTWHKLNDTLVGVSRFESFSRITESLSRDTPYLLFYVREDVQGLLHPSSSSAFPFLDPPC
jgi:hypothetical protein